MWLLEEKLDLAIICSPVRDRRIEYTPLFSDEALAILAPGHRLAQKPFLTAEDFAGETLLVYPPKEESIILTNLVAPGGLAFRAIQELTLTKAMLELVKAGTGITAMSRWSVAPQLEEGSLVAVPITQEGLWRDWSVARLKRKNTPAYVTEFLRVLTVTKLHGKMSLEAARRSRDLRPRAAAAERARRLLTPFHR
jgi:LysR family transcriptional regulator, regulator for metE and metH